jgi:hypothetical protein
MVEMVHLVMLLVDAAEVLTRRHAAAVLAAVGECREKLE